MFSQSHGNDKPGAATTLPACVGDVGCAGVMVVVMGEPVWRKGSDGGMEWVGGCSEWKSGEGPGPGPCADLSPWRRRRRERERRKGRKSVRVGGDCGEKKVVGMGRREEAANEGGNEGD